MKEELDKLAKQYEESIGSQDYCYLDVEDAFKAGYCKGTADQRKICIEMAVEYMSVNWRKYIDTDADGMIRFAGFKLELKKYLEAL